MTADDVTDAMVRAVNEVLARPWVYQNDAEAQTKAAIAAAINASGCVLVPSEPTEAMQRAGGHVNSEWLNDAAPIGEETTYTAPMRGVWKAMLAASPQPGKEKGDETEAND